MANCLLCGKSYPPANSKIIDPNHKEITICPQCYLERGNFNRHVANGKYDKARKIYEEWDKKLDQFCPEAEKRLIIENALVGGEGGNEEVDKFRRELLGEKLAMQDYLDRVKSCALTTGNSFDGCQIIAYHGIVSTIVSLTGIAHKLLTRLDEQKQKACYNLAEYAVQCGGNAVIGIKFDYIHADNSFFLVADGTAVTITLIQ